MKRPPIHEPGTIITRGFSGRYPESFFKHLEEILGVKFIYCAPRLIEAEKIEIRPLPPPTGKLYYIDAKYE